MKTYLVRSVQGDFRSRVVALTPRSAVMKAASIKAGYKIRNRYNPLKMVGNIAEISGYKLIIEMMS